MFPRMREPSTSVTVSLKHSIPHEDHKLAQTYKPGDTVPKTGTVECTQHSKVKDHVKEGRTFAPCMHWGQHDRKDCTWQYA